MWQVVLGGVIAIAGGVITQVLQNTYKTRSIERNLLFEIHDLLMDLTINIDRLQKEPKVGNEELEKTGTEHKMSIK